MRFDAHQARYIRERWWHEIQQIEEQPGGSFIKRRTGLFREPEKQRVSGCLVNQSTLMTAAVNPEVNAAFESFLTKPSLCCVTMGVRATKGT